MNDYQKEMKNILNAPLANDQQLCQAVDDLSNGWHRLAEIINVGANSGTVTVETVEVVKLLEMVTKNQIAVLHELRKMKRTHVGQSPLRKFNA